MKRLEEFWQDERIRELVRYAVVGALTTVVSVASYWLFMLPFGETPSNGAITAGVVISWILSVAFAYVANKRYVFRTRGLNARETLREAGAFVLARLFSLGFDMVFVLATVNWLGMNDKLAKILSNVLVIVINYVFSKLFIFTRSR